MSAGTVTFYKGPLGWAVAANGTPVGMIRKTRDGYLVAVTGFKPGVDKRNHLFQTLESAMLAVNRHFSSDMLDRLTMERTIHSDSLEDGFMGGKRR